MIQKVLKLLTVILVGQLVYAQDFEVAPVELNFNAEPGQSQKRIITVTNHSNERSTFKVLVKDFYFTVNGKTQYLKANAIKRSCANWMNVTPSFLVINPNESQEITVTMTVPPNDYSTRWAVIYIQTVQEQKASNVDLKLFAGINVGGRIAVEVTQSPLSNRNFRATISNFKEITQPDDTIRKFEVYVNNIGDKILNCKVYLIASNIKTLEEQKFKAIIKRVFPQTSIKYILLLPNTLAPGKYSLAAILDYGYNQLEGIQTQIEIK